MVLPVPRGAERTVGRCSMVGATGLAWLDERTLVLADRSRPAEVVRIRALDVETGAVRDITRPARTAWATAIPCRLPTAAA
jgi:hypothetical protein